ncbi:MAG: thioredoxin [Deltaproteobacteria bacterium]
MMKWVHLIRPQIFREEVANERRLVLLLCMPHNDAFHEQIQIIEELARLYANELKVMLTEESSLEAFKKDLAIVGTPTILFLKQGREIFRVLGLADLDMLRRFVGKALGNHPGGSPSENIGG